MTNPAPGWYDDGAGRQRWWDGHAWTEHFAEPPPPPAAHGVSRDFTTSLENLPIYYWAYTDPSDPTRGWVRAYHALDGTPTWDDPHRFADAEFDEYTGPPVNALVHSAHPQQVAALHPELRDIVHELDREIRARAGE